MSVYCVIMIGQGQSKGFLSTQLNQWNFLKDPSSWHNTYTWEVLSLILSYRRLYITDAKITWQCNNPENEILKTWLFLEPTLRPTYKSWKLSRFCTTLEHICGKTKKTISFLFTPSNQIHPTEEPNIIENHFCKQINNNSDIKAGRPAFILTK